MLGVDVLLVLLGDQGFPYRLTSLGFAVLTHDNRELSHSYDGHQTHPDAMCQRCKTNHSYMVLYDPPLLAYTEVMVMLNMVLAIIMDVYAEAPELRWRMCWLFFLFSELRRSTGAAKVHLTKGLGRF